MKLVRMMRANMKKSILSGLAVVLSAAIFISPLTQYIYAEEINGISVEDADTDSSYEAEDSADQNMGNHSSLDEPSQFTDEINTSSKENQVSLEIDETSDASSNVGEKEEQEAFPEGDYYSETQDSQKEVPMDAEDSESPMNDDSDLLDSENPVNDEESNVLEPDFADVGVFSTEGTWSLVQNEIQITLSSVHTDDDCYLSIDSDTDLFYFTAVSSDESVVKPYDESFFTSGTFLESIGPGTATITVTDQYGNSQKCKVIVDTEAISFEKDSVSINLCDEYGYFDITGGYNLVFESSNPSVVTVSAEEGWSWFEMQAVKPGTAIITATDPVGKTKSIEVTVTPPEWELEYTQKTDYLSGMEDLLSFTGNDMDLFLTLTSSNPKVVKVPGKVLPDEERIVEYVGVGTATVTITDQYGSSAVCSYTIKPDPISFDEYSVVNLNDYYNSEELYNLCSDGDSFIVSVTSSNTKVVKVSRIKKDDVYYLKINPVAAGNAVITAKDQYGQSATMKITITQRYIDESKYLDDLIGSGVYDPLIYGQSSIECYCSVSANVYTVINSKKYIGTVNSYGDYVIKGLPRLNAGTKVTVVFQKGQAKYSESFTVQKKFGGSLKTTVKQQTYSGKALKPAVRIVYGKLVLKAGTDYNVKYTNNKNVGTAKATITFKGNYKGSKAVTFKVIPRGTYFTKLKAVKKGFTATWKKQTTQTTGYQIQYCTNSKFSSGVKTITVSSTKTVTKAVKNLSKKKKYYVRIRTYKKIKKTSYYSTWSKVRNVTTK